MLITIFCIWVCIQLNAPWYISLLPFLHGFLRLMESHERQERMDKLTNALLNYLGAEDKENE